MAGLAFNAGSGELSLTAAAKLSLMVTAPANQRVHATGISVSLKGTTSTDAPALVELVRLSDAGTGGSSGTKVPVDPGNDETIQSTVTKGAFSGEPTVSAVLEQWEVHPQGGVLDKDFPFERPYVIPGGGRLGVRITPAVGVSAVSSLRCVE